MDDNTLTMRIVTYLERKGGEALYSDVRDHALEEYTSEEIAEAFENFNIKGDYIHLHDWKADLEWFDNELE